MIYRIIRSLWRVILNVFFRRIEIEGLGHVPAAGPVILAPNHTNALIDPMVLLTLLERPLTLTAKRSLTKNPLLRPLLRGLGVVLFDRSQDRRQGADPARNRAALADCRRRLRAGTALCIFPEGVSHSDPKMRPFKPGAALLALDYLEQEGNHGRLTIVPVGLHYEEKDRFRSSVRVRFGPPLDVARWLESNPGADRTALKKEIESRVRALTLNFERRRELYLHLWASELLVTGGLPPPELGRESAALADRVNLLERLRDGYLQLQSAHRGRIKTLERRVRVYRSDIRKRGITPAEVYLPLQPLRAAFFVLRELELLLVGLPLAAWGTINFFLPYQLVRAIGRALSRDKDQWASNMLFPAMAIFPLFALAQILAAFFLLPLRWAALYAIVLPYTGYYAVLYRDRAGGVWQRTKTFLLFLVRPELQARLVAEGRGIIAEVQSLAKLVN